MAVRQSWSFRPDARRAVGARNQRADEESQLSRFESLAWTRLSPFDQLKQHQRNALPTNVFSKVRHGPTRGVGCGGLDQ